MSKYAAVVICQLSALGNVGLNLLSQASPRWAFLQSGIPCATGCAGRASPSATTSPGTLPCYYAAPAIQRLASSPHSFKQHYRTMSFCAYFTTRAVSVVECVGIGPKVRIPKMTADRRPYSRNFQDTNTVFLPVLPFYRIEILVLVKAQLPRLSEAA
jgi:hypothetical protein